MLTDIVEVERALLATLIRHPDRWDDTLLAPGELGDPLCRVLWQVLSADGGVATLAEIVTRLATLRAGSKTGLDLAGGRAGLLDLIDRAHSPERVEQLVRTIKDAHRERTLAEAIAGSRTIFQSDHLTTDQKVARIQSSLDRIGLVEEDAGSIRPALEAFAADYLKHKANPDLPFGFRTHWPDVDKVLDGLEPPNMVVVASATGEGKSIFTSQLAAQLATRDQPDGARIGVGIFSVEMSKIETTRRWVAARARVNANHLRKARLGPDEEERVREATAWALTELEPRISYYGPEAFDTIDDIARLSHWLARKKDVRVIVVDYLQRINAPRFRNEKFQELGDVTSRLKEIAFRENLVILAVSQITREATREGARPTLSDMSDGSSIEKDFDYVAGLWRPAKHFDLPAIRRDWDGVAIFELLKGRFRSQGSCYLRFDAAQNRFDDLDSASTARLDSAPVQKELQAALAKRRKR